MTSSAAAAAALVTAPSKAAVPPAFLYANIGPELIRFDIDPATGSLARNGSIWLPDDVQYAWPNRQRDLLYVVTSDTAPGNAGAVGSSHHLLALAIDRSGGPMRIVGEPVALPSRPINVTTDARSEFVLVAFNKPSALRVYRVNPDGSPGEQVKQRSVIDAGIYAHQVRVSPDDRLAVLVTRGNEGTTAHPEEPGAVKVFRYHNGHLAHEVSIAPDAGRNFGPRHLDFHPYKPWVYLSIETQNQVAQMRLAGGTIQPSLFFRQTTLKQADIIRARQAAGPIHVHPNGRFLYVANRAEQTAPLMGHQVFKGGENSIAVFELDQATGEPRLIQHMDTHGIHARTFSIDPTGRMLVAEHNAPVWVRDGAGVALDAAGLSVFAIGDDGRLAFLRKYDFDVGEHSMFWSAMIGT